jgi:hypothetical protein
MLKMVGPAGEVAIADLEKLGWVARGERWNEHVAVVAHEFPDFLTSWASDPGRKVATSGEEKRRQARK